MAENELDGFLKGEAPPEPTPAPEPEKPAAETKPDPAAKVETPPEPEEAEPEAPREGEAVIPRRAFEAVRHERQDWKAKAVEAQTKLTELQRQLEEAKRPPPAPAVPEVPPQPIDPNTDPIGYIRALQEQAHRDRLNHRLDISEELVRDKIGAEAVDALITEFKAEAEKNPQLWPLLHSQRHPYAWLQKQVEVMRLQREIGKDPAAYRERIRQEAIAEFQKTNGGEAAAPRVSPAAGQAPSLAGVRSVAGRSAAAFTGPPSLDDILSGAPGRK